jgi:formylglycine-generating enzyme required for sulfatase activity
MGYTPYLQPFRHIYVQNPVRKLLLYSIILCLAICCRNRHTVLTSWDYNTPNNGGFEKVPYTEQELPPECVFVDGGIFNLVNKDGIEVKDTVNTFIVSRYEETNRQYRAYLSFLKRFKLEERYRKALPDTLFWIDENFTQEEKIFLVGNYLRSPAFDNYPVLGLTVGQVMEYAKWKTDRLNEMILIREGILDIDTVSTDTSAIFTTESYLSGSFGSFAPLRIIPDLKPTYSERPVRMEDGILMPRLRLLTLAEWEVAALDQGDSNYTYPVSKPFLRTKDIRKERSFDLFFMKGQKLANKPLNRKLSEKKLLPVNMTPKGNLGIYGLNVNACEFVLPEQNTCPQIGGSWKDSATNYGSLFVWGRYQSNGSFHPAQKEMKFHSGYTGFRLGMDVIGYPYPYTGKVQFKRKKAKHVR